MALPLALPIDDTPQAWFRQYGLPGLKARFGAEKYDAWLASLNLVGVNGETAYLTAATKFLCSWVRTHYSSALVGAIARRYPDVRGVSIAARTGGLQRSPERIPHVAAVRLIAPAFVHLREPRRPKIEEIQRLVAHHYGVGREDILSSIRTMNVVLPRQIAMYLSKVLTLRSLPEIGRRFAGRDHTTVLHAVRKIEGLRLTDLALEQEVSNLTRTCISSVSPLE